MLTLQAPRAHEPLGKTDEKSTGSEPMTTYADTHETRLDEAERLVGALLEILNEEARAGAHRTRLQALALAVGERPKLVADHEPLVDRIAVTDALLTLRSRGLAELEDDGFHLTHGGRDAVAIALKEANLPYEELKDLVLAKLQEWAADGAA